MTTSERDDLHVSARFDSRAAMNRASFYLFMLVLSVAPAWIFTAVAAAGVQDGFPLAIGNGPARLHWNTGASAVVLQFNGPIATPIEVARLARGVDDRAWHLAETVHTTVSDGRAHLTGPTGVETLLLIRATGHPGYILDGPFRWPPRSATYIIRTDWRKTIRGNSAGPHGSLVWVSADNTAVTGAACDWVDKTMWECVGVPLDAVGVVVMKTTGEVMCGMPSRIVSATGLDVARTRTMAWGRLVIVNAGPSARVVGDIRTSVKRLQPARSLTARAEVTLDTRIQVHAVADGVVWVAGGEVPDDGWIEIEANGRATERIETREVAAVPADLPLRVQLQPAIALSGRVKTTAGELAAHAVVTLYRSLRTARDRDPRPAPSVVVFETRADSQGAFRFDDLGLEPYEVVAVHPVFGTGMRRVTPDGRELEIRLSGASQRPPH